MVRVRNLRKDGRPAFWTHVEQMISKEPFLLQNESSCEQLYSILLMSLNQLKEDGCVHASVCRVARCTQCQWTLQKDACVSCKEPFEVIKATSNSTAIITSTAPPSSSSLRTAPSATRVCFPMFVPVADNSSTIHIKIYSLCSDACSTSFAESLTSASSPSSLTPSDFSQSTALSSFFSVFPAQPSEPHWAELVLHVVSAAFYAWLLRSLLQRRALGAHSALDFFAWVLITRGVGAWVILFKDVSVLLEVSRGTIQLFSRLALRWEAVSIPVQIFSSIALLLLSLSSPGVEPTNFSSSATYLSLLASPSDLYAASEFSAEEYFIALDSLPIYPILLLGVIPFLLAILEIFTASPQVPRFTFSIQALASMSLPVAYCLFAFLIFNLASTLPYPSLSHSIVTRLDFTLVAMGIIGAALGIFVIYYLIRQFILAIKTKMSVPTEAIDTQKNITKKQLKNKK